MKRVYLVAALLFSHVSFSQDIRQQLTKAVVALGNDAQFKHAAISMYVTAASTGSVLYEKDAELGMAPASTQKIITSASAFELLGSDFRYKTFFSYPGEIRNGIVKYIAVQGTGDPTLGSWRYTGSKEADLFAGLEKALGNEGIKKMSSTPIILYNKDFSTQLIPDGWIWQDMGNYYGAGAGAVNWRENQFDIIFKPGSEGEPALIAKMQPGYAKFHFTNEARVAGKESGDNAYVYPGLNNDTGFIRGTIPAGAKNFSISGSVMDPGGYLLSALYDFLRKKNYLQAGSLPGNKKEDPVIFFTWQSPVFDSINYWFLKRSINLYGEALVKTIAIKKGKAGSTDNGIEVIRDLWSNNGIDKASLNIIDGSGLSPANRITTKALVQILEYAKNKKWFSSFYNALPEMNGIKMKDGYIGGVRSYTGYVKSKAGEEYIFAFIVNNFNGSAATVREKMYRLLDLLK